MANRMIPTNDARRDPVDVVIDRARLLVRTLLSERWHESFPVGLATQVDELAGAFVRLDGKEVTVEEHSRPDVQVRAKQPDRSAQDVRADPPRAESGSSPAASERGATGPTLAFPAHYQAGCMTIWQVYKAAALIGLLAGGRGLGIDGMARLAGETATRMCETDPS